MLFEPILSDKLLATLWQIIIKNGSSFQISIKSSDCQIIRCYSIQGFRVWNSDLKQFVANATRPSTRGQVMISFGWNQCTRPLPVCFISRNLNGDLNACAWKVIIHTESCKFLKLDSLPERIRNLKSQCRVLKSIGLHPAPKMVCVFFRKEFESF